MSHKELFTVLGTVRTLDGRKRFIAKSPEHLAQCFARTPEGIEVAATFAKPQVTRSRSQLAYHWVLMGYLGEYVGCTETEMHEIVMRRKFGTKTVLVDGVPEEVRRSVSDAARMSKTDMSELIEMDLELCERLQVHVPTAAQLGYLPNH